MKSFRRDKELMGSQITMILYTNNYYFNYNPVIKKALLIRYITLYQIGHFAIIT